MRRLRDSLGSIRLGSQLTFYAGLLIGGAVSLAFYVLVFAAFLSGVLQALVAVGTLGLAGVTGYITNRDRREALARELADRVYVPMRITARAWMNPESLPTIIPTWTQLTDEIPYLTRNVPSALRKLFEKAEAIYGDTLTYSAPTVAFIQEFSKSSTQGANAIIFVFKETQQLAEIYMINIWKSGKNFSQYVVDFMKAAYPLLQEWNLQLWADVPSPSGVGTTKGKVGETKESIEYIDGLFRFLRSKSEAVTYREKYKELTKVGAEAFQQIEKELRKPVAPMISSTR